MVLARAVAVALACLAGTAAGGCSQCGIAQLACATDNDCPSSTRCIQGACVGVPADAGNRVVDAGVVPERDAGVRDAGVRDAGVRDAGVSDAGVSDAGTSGPDAGNGTDGGVVVASDGGVAGVDAGACAAIGDACDDGIACTQNDACAAPGTCRGDVLGSGCDACGQNDLCADACDPCCAESCQDCGCNVDSAPGGCGVCSQTCDTDPCTYTCANDAICDEVVTHTEKIVGLCDHSHCAVLLDHLSGKELDDGVQQKRLTCQNDAICDVNATDSGAQVNLTCDTGSLCTFENSGHTSDPVMTCTNNAQCSGTGTDVDHPELHCDDARCSDVINGAGDGTYSADHNAVLTLTLFASKGTNITCDTGSECTVAVAGSTSKVTLKCRGNASCDMHCDGAAKCECDGAACAVSCEGPGDPTTCPNDVVVCGQGC
ncbi:MAG TPA: hypothetical protein VGO62_09290 [Myxococcota bacterium]